MTIPRLQKFRSSLKKANPTHRMKKNLVSLETTKEEEGNDVSSRRLTSSNLGSDQGDKKRGDFKGIHVQQGNTLGQSADVLKHKTRFSH